MRGVQVGDVVNTCKNLNGKRTLQKKIRRYRNTGGTKIKVTLEQAMKAQRGSRGIAVLFLYHRRYMEGGWSTPHPGRFTHWKETRYSLYWRIDGPQERSGRVLKISPPPGFEPRTVQPVASRYTD